jgi:hypothetical protein
MQIAIHRPVSRFFFFSLPTFDEKTIKLHLLAEKLTETVLHLNLGHFVGFVFFGVQFCSTLCIPFDETTTEQHLRHYLQDRRLRRTPKFLRLKLHCIWTWRVFFYFLFFILFHFILFLYIYFFHLLIFYFYSYLYSFSFKFQSSLCLSNAVSAYGWLVHCLSLFVSLKVLLFVSLFCFFFLLDYLFFPFPLTSLLSITSHPSILNITSAIIIRQKILNFHTVQGQ